MLAVSTSCQATCLLEDWLSGVGLGHVSLSQEWDRSTGYPKGRRLGSHH